MALNKEQEQGHRACITGTDAPAIMGLSPFKTFADVWMEKRHPQLCEGPDERRAEMFFFGNKHELTIRDVYQERRNVTLVKPSFMVHPKVHWMGGSPDFFVEGKQLGVEAKTAEVWNRTEWGPAGTADIPIHYFIQCQHYMMLTGFKEWDCAALVGLYGFRIYHLWADEELQWMMFKAEEKFLDQYIMGPHTPEFDTGEQVRAYCKKRYPTATKDKCIEVAYGDAELKKTLLGLRASRLAESQAKQKKELGKTLLMAYMKDAEKLVWEEEAILVYYRNNKPRTKVKWMDMAQEAMKDMPPEARKALMDKYTTIDTTIRPLKMYDKNAGGDDDE